MNINPRKPRNTDLLWHCVVCEYNSKPFLQDSIVENVPPFFTCIIAFSLVTSCKKIHEASKPMHRFSQVQLVAFDPVKLKPHAFYICFTKNSAQERSCMHVQQLLQSNHLSTHASMEAMRLSHVASMALNIQLIECVQSQFGILTE